MIHLAVRVISWGLVAVVVAIGVGVSVHELIERRRAEKDKRHKAACNRAATETLRKASESGTQRHALRWWP